MDKLYMWMFGRLPSKPTGLATSVLRRGNALKSNGIDNTILTHVYNPTHNKDMNTLRENGLLISEVKYLYNDLAGETEIDNRPEKDPFSEYREEGFFLQDETNAKVERLYLNGEYKLFIWKEDFKNVTWVDQMNSSFLREQRTWFDDKGYVRKIEFFNTVSKNKVRVLNYDQDGFCFLSTFYKNEGKDIAEILYFNKLDRSVKKFGTIQDMMEYWLRTFVFNKKDNIGLISEYAYNWELFKKFEEEFNKFEVVYTIHNSHYAAPYKEGSPIRSDMNDNLFKHLDKLKTIIVLTKEQKKDILLKFDHVDKFKVIPHHMAESKQNESVKRNPYRLISASRFEKIKNIPEIIEAFALINKEIPETELLLFGRGSEEQSYKDQIEKLGLTGKAKVAGFTTDVHKEFSEASISLYTSKYEGFCLSLAEGMSNGCIPVTYDFKYGPRDIIDEGENGVICEETPQDMADAVIGLLRDQEKLESMREKAKQISSKFSEERLVNDWTSLFKELGFTGLSK